MVILDTNVISEPLRKQPDARVTAWLDAQAIETLALTTVTVAELRYGVACLPAGRRAANLERDIEGRVLPLFADRIYSFDADSSGQYGRRRAVARAHGLAVGDFDALIAAIAASRDCVVATRDVAAFEAMGVRVIDPFDG